VTTLATHALFPEAFAELKGRAGLTFRQLAERTRAADPHGRGLSHGHLSRLASGDEPLLPDAMRLIAAALDEIDGPEYFVEYRMAQLRDAFDPRHGDPRDALQRFLAWESLPAAQRDLILNPSA
jgi:transcriptional regulator with XRE-family HTH domain